MTDLADTSWIPRYIDDVAGRTLDEIPQLVRMAWDWALHFPETGGEGIEDLIEDINGIVAREKARLGDADRINAEARAAALRAARHAAHAVREKAAEDEQRRQRRERDFITDLTGLTVAGIAKGINPRGCFIYLLWESKGDDTPVYVGKSTNVLSRLGDHMRNAAKKHHVGWVTLFRCEDIARMEAAERRLIRRYRPKLNIQGIGTSSDEKEA